MINYEPYKLQHSEAIKGLLGSTAEPGYMTLSTRQSMHYTSDHILPSALLWGT